MHAFSYIFGRFMVRRTMKFSILSMEKPRKNIVFLESRKYMKMHAFSYILQNGNTNI